MNIVSQKYRILGKKGEGTFSEVLKCQSIKDGSYWACKKMKQLHESHDQVNNLREIQALRRLSPHANIITLQEVIFDQKTGVLVLVCELMDMNIYELIRGRRAYLPEQKVKNYMYQLCKSMDHLHKNGIFHRDVKPENILISNDTLKLADFGSCRSIYSKQPYTEYISTRWYRAPECLLTDGYYTYKMDLWSVGCVIYEILSLHPLFPGSNEVDQIAKIHDVMGSPDPSVLNKLKNKARGMNFKFPEKKGTGIEPLLPHCGKEAIDLIYQLCTYDPDERTTARNAVRHPYFKDLRYQEKRALAKAQAVKAKENDEPVSNKDSVRESVRESLKSDRIDEEREKSDNSIERTNNKKNLEVSNEARKNSYNSDDKKISPYMSSLHQPKPLIMDRRRMRRKHVVAPMFSHGTIFSRVPRGPLQSNANNAYNMSFPRIHGSSMMPSMPSLAAYRGKPKAVTQPPSKVTYAHYHLPPIAKNDHF